jgi:hypothetical protein
LFEWCSRKAYIGCPCNFRRGKACLAHFAPANFLAGEGETLKYSGITGDAEVFAAFAAFRDIVIASTLFTAATYGDQINLPQKRAGKGVRFVGLRFVTLQVTSTGV